MVKPMLPILDYYFNYDYIATQLCENRDKPILDCNGKCYVAKEIEKNNKNSHQDTIVPEFKMDFYLFNDFEIITFKEINFSDITLSSPISKDVIWKDNFLISIFHPPEII